MRRHVNAAPVAAFVHFALTARFSVSRILLSIMETGTVASDLQTLKSQPLRAQVFTALRDVIVAGRYQPGDALREVAIAGSWA